MSWARLFDALAGVARIAEDPELFAQFKERVRTMGKAAAHTWLDNHAAEAGLDPAMIRHIKEELDRQR